MVARGLAIALLAGFLLTVAATSGLSGEKSPVKVTTETLRRPRWTTSRFRGTPEPAHPYEVEVAFPNLKFFRPATLTGAPQSDRLFLVEVDGKIYSFPNRADVEKAELFFDVRAHVPKLVHVYGMTFHPQYPAKPYVYLCYVLQGTDPDGTKISRFTVRGGDVPTVDPASEKIVLTFLAGGHNGCCLKFGPDGYLYISTGDGTGPSPPDVYLTGQDCSDLLSSILRIDVDHEDNGLAYRIPPDNPFVGQAGIRPEIWAFGFRNPWKMSFDPKSGDLWVGDVGWESWELVDRVVKGGNYGWSVTEGDQPVFPEGKVGPTPILPPTVQHPHSEARSITGGYFYYGDRLADLHGNYIYGDWSTGKLWALRYGDNQVQSLREIADTSLQIVDFTVDQAGELLILDYETTGQIYRLVPNPDRSTGEDFPRKLSETGLFASVREHQVQTGILPFSINVPMWQDGASAERFLAVPENGQLKLQPNGEFTFPNGTVLVKTISAPSPDDSRTDRRLETQVLHFENESWRPYSYVWNEDQTDATLVAAGGAELSYRFPGSTRTQTWHIASRTECNLCHSPYLGSVLSFNATQLRPQSVKEDDQWTWWQELELFAAPMPELSSPVTPLVDVQDDTLPVDRRARSYLHANCQHCHRPNGGGTSTIHLSAGIPLEQMQIANVAPSLGNFSLEDGRIVVPGDPYRSILFLRMSKLGGGHMPHVGARVIDDRGLQLVHNWIVGLAKTGTPTAAPVLASMSETDLEETLAPHLQSVSEALGLAYELTRKQVEPRHLQEIARFANGSENIIVRDLFERFLPEEERQSRLGDQIDATSLLQRSGDAKRGRDLFHLATTLQCRSCHRVHGNGGEIGPDLSEIGRKLDRTKLLESMLAPSAVIDERFRTYSVLATDGVTSTGLLIEQSEDGIAIRQADGDLRRFQRTDIEELKTSEISLMPEKLLRDLTESEAADLLEYLSSLR